MSKQLMELDDTGKRRAFDWAVRHGQVDMFPDRQQKKDVSVPQKPSAPVTWTVYSQQTALNF